MAIDLGRLPQSDVFRIDLDPAGAVAAYVAHRRRFASSVSRLDESALASPSRCSKWSVADVLRHGCDVDRWVRTIWAGDLPFDSFDPRVIPHEEVAEARSLSDADVRDRYVVSSREMAADVENTGPEQWAQPSFSFAGPMPWWQALLHMFFDSWVHERDVLLPLGVPVEEAEDEVTAVLMYLLALVPHASRLLGREEEVDAVVCGFHVTARNRPITVSPAEDVPTGVPVLDGDAPSVIDALSGRGDLEEVLSGDREVIDRLAVLGRHFSASD